MTRSIALALLLAAGCSDPAADAPDALRGTCGDAGPGMQWTNQPGCVSTCSLVNGSVRNQLCRTDAGVPFCAALDDPRNCGECGHDCLARECAPAGGITYTATCAATGCRCAPPKTL